MPKIIAEMPVRIRRDLSIAELIEYSHFTRVDEYIRTIADDSIETEEAVRIAKLVYYWYTSGTEGSPIMQDMKCNLGLRPATFRELLELGIGHPEHPCSKEIAGIVALGTRWERFAGCFESPIVWRIGEDRYLRSRATNGKWNNANVFLAFDAEPAA